MSQIEIDRVLSQIRSFRTEASAAAGTVGGITRALDGISESPASVSFASVLRNGLDQVNAAQNSASMPV